MSKPFAFDVDDVIGWLSTVLNPALNATFGKQISIADWQTFDLSGLYGISHQQLCDCIIENRLLSTMPPTERIGEALRAFRDRGADIVFITSRGYHPQAEQVTYDWLAEAQLPCTDVIIVPEGVSKGEIAKKRYPQGFEMFVDDHAPNLDSMREHGLVKNTILINRPWNAHRNDYTQDKDRFQSLYDYTRSPLFGRDATRVVSEPGLAFPA